MAGRYYKRIPIYKVPQIEGCALGDEAIWFPGAGDGLHCDEIPYAEIQLMWTELYNWILEIVQNHSNNKESLEYMLGNEILPYVEERDAFGTKFSIRIAGESFDKIFMLEDMSEQAKKLIDILMYEPPKYFDLIMGEGNFYSDKYFGVDKVNEACYGSIFA